MDSSGNWSPVYNEIYTKSGDVQGVVIYVQDASYYTSGSLNDQIQSILDSAAPGTTIKFLGQSYEGLHLVLNKQLKIISEVATKISASDSLAVFLINGTQASGSTIKGFTIINTGTGSGIVVNNTKNVTISNDEVSSTSGTAILVNGSSNTTIRSSSIHGDGISVINHENTTVLSTIINNNVNNTYYGIWQGGFQGTISGNTIDNSLNASVNLTAKSCGEGCNNLNANVTNNTINNAPIGISIEQDVKDVNITNNNINNTTYGVSAVNKSNIHVENNKISNTKNAVYFNQVNKSSVKSNNITNSTGYGVNVDDNGSLSSYNNEFSNNTFTNTKGTYHLHGHEGP